MANAWVLESPTTGIYQGVSVPITPMGSSVTVQTKAFTTAANFAAFQSGTRFVRFVADANAHISITGTATASSWYVPSGTVFDFEVGGGETLSVYDGSS